MREQEGKTTYIGGCEESYGYLIGSEVRDKDAVSACALIAEAVAYAKSIGKTAFEYLLDIYAEYGLYHENLVSVTKKGKTGAEEIQAMMKRFRENPPKQLAGSEVVEIRDYQVGKIQNLVTGETKETGLESSNVLQFITANGAKVSARPSGTEPKIKFYFSLHAPFEGKDKYDSTIASLEAQIKEIVKDLNV
jgi:phosphoglucomutase